MHNDRKTLSDSFGITDISKDKRYELIEKKLDRAESLAFSPLLLPSIDRQTCSEKNETRFLSVDPRGSIASTKRQRKKLGRGTMFANGRPDGV